MKDVRKEDCIEAVREKGYIRDRNKELSEDFK